MKILRPIRLEDTPYLNQLIRHATYGLTSLPKDQDLLRERVRSSVNSFNNKSPSPAGETYLFVLEDLHTGKLVGVSGIVSKVGGFEPWYTYRIIKTLHTSDTLKVRHEVAALHLVADHDGPCEIGSLFLSPAHRQKGNGRLLSLGRFLFMANHKKRFDPIVIAEMRGIINSRGHSPFWDSLGRHFFAIDFPRADHLSMVNKKFIADLMPTHPIYIPLLPTKAQKVIGAVHPRTLPAIKILEKEGFEHTDMVDIFEAGPVVQSRLRAIRSVRDSQVVRTTHISESPLSGPLYMISNTRIEFRACLGTIQLKEPGSVTLNHETAMALHVKIGDRIRIVLFRPDSQKA